MLIHLLRRKLILDMNVTLSRLRRKCIQIHPGMRGIVCPSGRCRLQIGRSGIVDIDIDVVCDMVALVNILAISDITESACLKILIVSHT